MLQTKWARRRSMEGQRSEEVSSVSQNSKMCGFNKSKTHFYSVDDIKDKDWPDYAGLKLLMPESKDDKF